MLVIGQLFVAGKMCEALLLLASIGVGLASGPYKPNAVAFTVIGLRTETQGDSRSVNKACG